MYGHLRLSSEVDGHIPHILYGCQKGRDQWDWEVGASQLGSARCRMRGIIVFPGGGVRSSKQLAPIHILHVVIRGNLIDLLQPPTQYVAVIMGEWVINTGTNQDISQPTPMGRINLPLEYPTPGVKVKTATSSGILHSMVSIIGLMFVWTGRRGVLKRKSLQCLPTRYLVYYAAGLRFPIGGSAFPSGRARAIIYDPGRSVARSLSQLE